MFATSFEIYKSYFGRMVSIFPCFSRQCTVSDTNPWESDLSTEMGLGEPYFDIWQTLLRTNSMCQ